jgi:hypothetical protein
MVFLERHNLVILKIRSPEIPVAVFAFDQHRLSSGLYRAEVAATGLEVNSASCSWCLDFLDQLIANLIERYLGQAFR